MLVKENVGIIVECFRGFLSISLFWIRGKLVCWVFRLYCEYLKVRKKVVIRNYGGRKGVCVGNVCVCVCK